MIKLAELDPVAVAEEVTGWVTGHIFNLAFQIDPSLPLRWPTPLSNTGLGLAVRELTAYAQHGPPHCDDAGGPAEYLQTVIEALHTSSHPDGYARAETTAQGRGEPEHAIDVVIRAALARETIERGVGKVPLAWLGAIAGLPVATMYVYVSRGELKANDGDVTCREARRWLSGRGVEIAERGL